MRQRAEENFSGTIINFLREKKDNIASVKQEHSAINMKQ